MIVSLKNEEKAYIEDILRALPDWFGIEAALLTYVEECQRYKVLGYMEKGEIVGFLALKETSASTLELYVMGILPSFHHKGIGKALFMHAKTYAKNHGYEYIQVKTLSPDVNDQYYLNTYAFYKSQGFKDVEVLPLWDDYNPSLLMIQHIK